MTDRDHLLHEIDGLLTAGDEGTTARLEELLTTGYAHVLALESERRRLERRVVEHAGKLAEGERAGCDELSELHRDVARADAELERLRRVLAPVHRHVSAVRASGPAA